MFVVCLTLHLHVPTEQEAGWTRDLAWKPWRSEKSLDPARNLTSVTHSSIQATDYQPHQLHYHSYPSTVSLILNICHICKKNLFPAATSHLGRNESRSNLKIDYSKMETMTKLILTCTVQFCVLFSYKLCACHMTGCHYIQALFHSGCAPCTADIKRDFRLPPYSRWDLHCCGLL